jgi:hypothetical protein
MKTVVTRPLFGSCHLHASEHDFQSLAVNQIEQLQRWTTWLFSPSAHFCTVERLVLSTAAGTTIFIALDNNATTV